MLDPFLTQVEVPDPAALFACATSLWQACQEQAANDPSLDLTLCYNGQDGLMRIVMRIGNHFETRACLHVDFDELSDVWPYLLQDEFGAACLAVISPTDLDEFDDSDCLQIALDLQLPLTASR